MKNKKSIILGLLVTLFVILPIVANAQVGDALGLPDFVDITYKPNVPIPITINGYNFAGENTIHGGDFLASYIVAIYTYGAGFAGIVAMFMLVIAAWRWLMAAGNAQKINESKDMVTSVLIGLALLFGGQLLLRQISSDFDSIQSLTIKLPEAALRAVELSKAEEAFCKGIDENGVVDEDKIVENCEDYKDETSCRFDVCKLVGVGDFDDTCTPVFKGSVVNNNLEFDECIDCPWSPVGRNCSCSFYSTAEYKRLDPCDCDNDDLGGATEDPDGCTEPVYGGGVYGGGGGGTPQPAI
ncbi:MAG: hypothetical protein WCS88_01475 [Patescibacteria group bacterium]|jgi:hypothetical protein